MNLDKGRIFNIQRFSTEDGPGIRTTVFLKGCPLRCIWCANPESQSAGVQIAHRKSQCIGCGRCLAVCPVGAVSCDAGAGQPGMRIAHKLCTSCAACVSECPAEAMRAYGREAALDEVMDTISRDLGYYRRSGGGVTVSGGEPMMQAEFVSSIFRACKEKGIHTALDTSGYFPSEQFEKVRDCVDLVLFDVKLMDSDAHIKYTGVDNRLIHKNAYIIADSGAEMLIRIPVIPDINDSYENLSATARFVLSLGKRVHVDLLPYHNYGENKYEMLGMDYLLHKTVKPSRESMLAYKKIFDDCGIDCAAH